LNYFRAFGTFLALIPLARIYTVLPQLSRSTTMATIRNRGPYQCQAIVRKRGYPEQRRTFETEREANDWAAGLEVDMTRSAFVDRSLLERTTFGDLLARYLQEVTPKEAGFETKTSRIRQLQK
jgi:hypothetical protein